MTHRRGVAAIELALILPVLLAMIFGIIDWSYYLYERLNVGVVANRGVRLAAGNAAPGALATATVCEALPFYALECGDGTVTALVVSHPSGSALELNIALPFDPPVGLIPTPNGLRVTASTSWYGDEP
jgi:hypothetical protein